MPVVVETMAGEGMDGKGLIGVAPRTHLAAIKGRVTKRSGACTVDGAD